MTTRGQMRRIELQELFSRLAESLVLEHLCEKIRKRQFAFHSFRCLNAHSRSTVAFRDKKFLLEQRNHNFT